MAKLYLLALIFHGLSPLSPIAFKWVNFEIVGIIINQYNAIGLFMVIVTAVYQIVSYLFLNNLTHEPGYAIFLRIEGKEEDQISTSKNKLMTVKEIVANYEINLVLLAVFILGFSFSQFEVGINLIAATKFNWSINYLAIVIFFSVCLAVASLEVLSQLNSEVHVNFLFVSLSVTFSILFNLMNLQLIFEFRRRMFEVPFILVSYWLTLTGGFCIRILSSGLLFIIVPFHSRCSIIGVRQVMLKIAVGGGYFLGSLMFQRGLILYPIWSSLCLVLAFIRLFRSREFLRKYTLTSR